MILGGGIIRSGGNTKIIMVIDIVGTWCIGIPLCLLAAYVFNWGIVRCIHAAHHRRNIQASCITDYI